MTICAAHFFSISSSIFFALLAIGVAAQEKCPSFCRYRFCHHFFRDGTKLQLENRFFTLHFPDTGFGPFPCIAGPDGVPQELRNVTGGEARVSRLFRDDFTPISKFRKHIVFPRFSPNQFGWRFNEENNRSTIGRIQSRGNQEEHLHRLCVQMPITSFVTSTGVRLRTREKDACVGFRTEVSKLLVSFRWDSTDDFDLALEEPNGFEINRLGEYWKSHNGGRLKFDNGAVTCQEELLEEQIWYKKDSPVEAGTYTIRVDHYRKCEPSTRYTLGVMYMGKMIFSETGTLKTFNVETMPDVVVRPFTI